MSSKLPGDPEAVDQGLYFEFQGQSKRPRDFSLTFHAYVQETEAQVKMPQFRIKSELKFISKP